MEVEGLNQCNKPQVIQVLDESFLLGKKRVTQPRSLPAVIALIDAKPTNDDKRSEVEMVRNAPQVSILRKNIYWVEMS